MKTELSLSSPVSTYAVYPVEALPRTSWILSIISVPFSQLWSPYVISGLQLWFFFSGLSLCQVLGVCNHLEALNQWLCWPSSLALGGVTLRQNQLCSASLSDQDFAWHPNLTCLHPLLSPVSPHSITGFSWEPLLHKLLAYYSHLKMRELDLG